MAVLPSTASVPPPAGPRPVRSIMFWAVIGAALLALTLYVLAAWVLSPDFVPVRSGPDEPPGWMKATLVGGQIALVVGSIAVVYRFIIRPWRREHTVTTDGLMVVASFFCSFFDPLSVWGQNWFNYNSYLVNFGSPMSAFPGVISYQAAGAGNAFPIIAIPGFYVALVVPFAVLGCRVMSTVKRRFPQFGAVRMILACYLLTLPVVAVAESQIFVHGGFWTLGGGRGPAAFGDHWYKYPAQELLHVTAIFTGIVCFRYFTSDKGHTIVERGLDRVHVGFWPTVGLRFLAINAGVKLVFLITFQIPVIFWGLNSTEWPTELQNLSYFTGQFCGPDVNRACPGPRVPVAGPGDPYSDFNGNLVNPAAR